MPYGKWSPLTTVGLRWYLSGYLCSRILVHLSAISLGVLRFYHGQIANLWVHWRNQELGLNGTSFKNHVVDVGWNDFGSIGHQPSPWQRESKSLWSLRNRPSTWYHPRILYLGPGIPHFFRTQTILNCWKSPTSRSVYCVINLMTTRKKAGLHHNIKSFWQPQLCSDTWHGILKTRFSTPA